MRTDTGRRPAPLGATTRPLSAQRPAPSARRYAEMKPTPEQDGDDKRHAATAHYVTGDRMLGAELTHPPQHPKPQKPHYLTESDE